VEAALLLVETALVLVEAETLGSGGVGVAVPVVKN
jgi:hypothetical protein